MTFKHIRSLISTFSEIQICCQLEIYVVTIVGYFKALVCIYSVTPCRSYCLGEQHPFLSIVNGERIIFSTINVVGLCPKLYKIAINGLVSIKCCKCPIVVSCLRSKACNQRRESVLVVNHLHRIKKQVIPCAVLESDLAYFKIVFVVQFSSQSCGCGRACCILCNYLYRRQLGYHNVINGSWRIVTSSIIIFPKENEIICACFLNGQHACIVLPI